MKKPLKDYLLTFILSFVFLGVLACSSDKESTPETTIKVLTANTSKIDFDSKENTSDVTINSEAGGF